MSGQKEPLLNSDHLGQIRFKNAVPEHDHVSGALKRDIVCHPDDERASQSDCNSATEAPGDLGAPPTLLAAQQQKYRKRARRSRRAQRTQKHASGLALLHPDVEVSDSATDGDDVCYRIAAYCTCDTYQLQSVYSTVADRARLPPRSSDAAPVSSPHVPTASTGASARVTFSQTPRFSDGLHHPTSVPLGAATLLELLDSARVSLTFYGSDVLHIKIRSDGPEGTLRNAFVFEYGCVACFGFTPAEEGQLLALLRPCEEDTLPAREQEAGTEDLEFVYGVHSHVASDRVTLSSESPLEKLSVAFAMAQCVKLNVFEERVDQEITRSKELPESLATTGSIGLTRNEMARMIGQLFIQRNNVNLHADILDDPEFFWEQDRYKHVYEKLFKYLELGKRVGLLNKRLGIMKELYDMVAGQLEVAHAEKLELIIIYLIVVEVIVMVGWQILIKDVLGFFNHGGH